MNFHSGTLNGGGGGGAGGMGIRGDRLPSSITVDDGLGFLGLFDLLISDVLLSGGDGAGEEWEAIFLFLFPLFFEEKRFWRTECAGGSGDGGGGDRVNRCWSDDQG